MLRRGLVAFGFWFGLSVSAGADTLYEHRVTASDLAAALHDALAGVQVHLHNHGRLVGSSYHASNAASIKWPAKDGPGKRDRFTLPDASRVVLGRRYGYYVNHVRAEGIFVAPQPDRLTATLLLRSNGPSLMGKCVTVARPETPCGIGGEAAMPAVEWRDARIDVDLVPIVYHGSLAFNVGEVTISGDIGVGAACSWPVVGMRLCSALNRALETTRKKIADEVRSSLNDPDVKKSVAAAVRDYLDKGAQVPILGVKRVSMADGIVRIGLGLRF